jgi:thiol:disulfide interchange protein DsbD
LALGLGLAIIPEIVPAGPAFGLDASSFLASGQFMFAAGLIFVGGLGTSLTPCVYPLIPITVSVFGARKGDSRARAVVLSSAYVLGMSVVFSTLGVIAALTGKAFGSALGSPWVVAGLAVFLLVLATSMFGAFELALPSSWATKLSGVGGGGLLGALLMGSVSGFLAAPCTGPVLFGVLAFIATSQSPALGAALLFVYSLGIGVPFFLIGVFTVRLPKSGLWMEWVKSFFGVALVALSATYLRDASTQVRHGIAGLAEEVGRHPGVALATLLVVAGVMLGAIDRSFKEGARNFAFKGLGVLLVMVAVLVRGGAGGAPVDGKLWLRLGIVKPVARQELKWALHFPVRGAAESGAGPFDEALKTAAAQGKPVMIDFYADWCAACKELDQRTYVETRVVGASERFVNIKVDGTDETDTIQKLYARFGVQGLPTVAFIDSRGELMAEPRVTGFVPAADFLLLQAQVR